MGIVFLLPPLLWTLIFGLSRLMGEGGWALVKIMLWVHKERDRVDSVFVGC